MNSISSQDSREKKSSYFIKIIGKFCHFQSIQAMSMEYSSLYHFVKSFNPFFKFFSSKQRNYIHHIRIRTSIFFSISHSQESFHNRIAHKHSNCMNKLISYISRIFPHKELLEIITLYTIKYYINKSIIFFPFPLSCFTNREIFLNYVQYS